MIIMPVVSYTPNFHCESTENAVNVSNTCAKVCNPKFETKSESIVSEWNLVCERQFLLTLPDSLFMTGNMLGAVVIGPLVDRLG